MAVDVGHERDLRGLDRLDLAPRPGRAAGSRVWDAAWPKALAVGLFLTVWQVVVWSGWRPEYVLPSPAAVGAEFLELAARPDFWQAIGVTMQRGLVGFTIAVVIGGVVGVATARLRHVRSAIGSLITGLQTMPSIAWFPLAILLFQLSEQAIYFVVVLGAAPSIANGVIQGVDFVPPLLQRVGRNLGASGFGLYRHVILPASLPSIVAGLKQGWAFAWRSLMAGELLVIMSNPPSLGVRLQLFRELNDAQALIVTMLVILVIGIVVDLVFAAANRAIRSRWGMVDTASL
jgi:NitT/TauT family transport system permease protein